MKKINAIKVIKKPQNIIELLMLHVLCFLLSMSIAMGICYAYFTSKIDGENRITAGTLNLQYLDEAEGAEINNLVVYNTRDGQTNLIANNSTVMPGDRLSIRGNVTNDVAGSETSIPCYALVKLEVTKTFDNGGDRSYTDTIWYTLNGSKVSADANGRYTTEPTALASGANVDLNIDYVLDGYEMDNSYVGKNVNVTITLAAYQKEHIANDTYLGASDNANVYSSLPLQVTHHLLKSEVDIWAEDTVASSSLTGTGAEQSPYLISSVADLLYFANNFSGSASNGKYFKLNKNLDLNNKPWTPVSNFNGIVDGNGFSVNNVNIQTPVVNGNASYIGFFSSTHSDSIIKNLTIKKLNMNYTCTTSECFAGGIVGSTYKGQIENCVVIGANTSTYDMNITSSSTMTRLEVGGIAGQFSSDNSSEYTLKNCYSIVDISGAKATTIRIGGISGNCINSYIKNTYFVGNLNTSSCSTINLGLISGSVSALNVTGCFAVSSSSSNAVGNGAEYVINCAVANPSSSTIFTKVGSNCTGIVLDTTNIKDVSVLRDALGFSFESWCNNTTALNQGYPSLRIAK